MSTMSHYKRGTPTKQDGEYLDAAVTPKIDTPKDMVKDSVLTAGVVVASDEMEAQLQQEQSEKPRFEGEIGDAKGGDKSEDYFQKRMKGVTLDWYVYTMAAMTLVLLALVAYGFGSRLFLPNKTLGDNSVVAPTNTNDIPASGAEPSDSSSQSSSDAGPLFDRQDYKDIMLTLLGLPTVMERNSPQAQAIEWLAFEDEPLFDLTTILPEDLDHYRDLLVQRYALVVWYFDQGGPTVWTKINTEVSSGWIQFGAGIHECDWTGVNCDYGDDEGKQDVGRVVELNLSPINGLVMTGSSLSTELGLLTNLRNIDFSDQRLQGKIPDEWSTLSNLEMVLLSKNQLQSTIPEWIWGWKNLTHLALDINQLYGTIPSSFANLQNLKRLELASNPQLRGRFDDVLFSSGLKHSLQHIDLSDTDLEGELPNDTLPSLTSLILWHTRGFGGTIPPEIGSWSNLNYFGIKGNSKLVGSIPTEFGLLQKLIQIEIINCNFMSGTLPTELGNLSSNLEFLSLRDTNRTGNLPSEWSNLGSLQVLDVTVNKQLMGKIPPEYSKLTSLQLLDLRQTGLTGEVPEDVCSLKSREQFLVDCFNEKATISCLCCSC